MAKDEMSIEQDFDVIHRKLRTCNPIIEDYSKSMVRWKTLETLKTLAKGKRDDVAIKDNMTNDVATIQHMANEKTHAWRHI